MPPGSPSLATCQAGLASLRFDFSGNGDSGGTFRYGHYRGEAEELRAAKAHLEGQLGRTVSALIGHSKGGTSCVMYAGKVRCARGMGDREHAFQVEHGAAPPTAIHAAHDSMLLTHCGGLRAVTHPTAAPAAAAAAAARTWRSMMTCLVW